MPNEQPQNNLPADAPWWFRWMAGEVRDFWKWATTWLLAIAAALPAGYELAPQLQLVMSPTCLHWVQAGLAFLTFVNLIRRKPA